jgi:hypothetical protein
MIVITRFAVRIFTATIIYVGCARAGFESSLKQNDYSFRERNNDIDNKR